MTTTEPNGPDESNRENDLLTIAALGSVATMGDTLSHAGILVVVVLLLWGGFGK